MALRMSRPVVHLHFGDSSGHSHRERLQKAAQLAERRQAARDVFGERVERTSDIAERHAGHLGYEGGHRAREELASSRILSVQPHAADEVVAVRQRFNQAGNVGRITLQIGVQRHEISPARERCSRVPRSSRRTHSTDSPNAT